MSIPNGQNPMVDSIIQTGNGTGISALRMAKAIYSFAIDGGVVSTITPNGTVALPAGTVIVGATINSTTAVTSGGAGTLAIGTSAGSSSTSILAATAKASLSLNALLNGVPVFATPVKLTAAGNITFTIGTTALTAGVVEVNIYYFIANA